VEEDFPVKAGYSDILTEMAPPSLLHFSGETTQARNSHSSYPTFSETALAWVKSKR
jgi:hypothetical protein